MRLYVVEESDDRTKHVNSINLDIGFNSNTALVSSINLDIGFNSNSQAQL